MVVAENSVLVGTIDGFLNWIDADSGTVTKRVPLGGYPYGTPVPSGPRLFLLVNGETAKLLALDVGSGSVIWTQESEQEWSTYRPLVVGSVIFVGNAEIGLCAFDQADGSVRWRRPVAGIPRGLRFSSDGTLYVGALSGVVQAFALDKSDIK